VTITARVVTDPSSLAQTSSGAIVGEVHVRVGALAFPEERWSDFVVVVLGWWLRALVSLTDRRDTVELHFMDGPFAVLLQADRADQCRAAFLRGERPWSLLPQPQLLTCADLVGSVRTEGRRVLEACREMRMASPDLSELESALMSLR
jgi:hypothetical protein